MKDPIPPSIAFTPLRNDHFPLLHRWLNAPHVTKYWDDDRQWSLSDVAAKYSSYVKGFKLAEKAGEEIAKPLQAFIIVHNGYPLGYIQCYNAYDFPRENDISIEDLGLPESLASLDLYIGEQEALGKGLGPVIILQFIEKHIWPSFNACFLDCALDNNRARRAYEKAGFIITTQQGVNDSVWMLKVKEE